MTLAIYMYCTAAAVLSTTSNNLDTVTTATPTPVATPAQPSAVNYYVGSSVGILVLLMLLTAIIIELVRTVRRRRKNKRQRLRGVSDSL